MEFKVHENSDAGAFVFTAPGSQDRSDEFDEIVEVYRSGRLSDKRMIAICEQMIRLFPPLMQPYHMLATILLKKGKTSKALTTAMRGLAAVNHMFPDDFRGRLEWLDAGNRPYLALMKTILLCHVNEHQHQRAVDWIGMIRRIDPDDSCGARFVIGHEQLRTGAVADAQACFAEHAAEYSPYWYELGLSLFNEHKLVEAATAFRRGFAVNPYIAEMIFHAQDPNPYAVMHYAATERPQVASQYVNTYDKLWAESREAQRFLYWLYNQSDVMHERANLMACREQRSLVYDDKPSAALEQRYADLLASIDDRLSVAVVQRRDNGDGELEWPWEVYVDRDEI